MKTNSYIMLLLLGVIALFYFVVDPNEVDFLLSCPLYSSTGVFCPGCGSQRALHDLLHGNIKSALSNNFMLILGILLSFYHFGIMLINKLFNKEFYSFLSSFKVRFLLIGLVLLFWILRNVGAYPFTLLSPS